MHSRSSFHPLRKDDFPFVLSLSKRRIQDGFLNEKELLAYVQGGLLSGLVLAMEGKDIGYVLYRKDDYEGEIDEIAILEEAEGKGYASLLLGHALREMTDGKRETCFLEVREKNAKARSLYERNGFVAYRRRAHYYPNDDGICYRKEL